MSPATLIPWALFGIVTIIFVLLSLVLVYHWNRFGRGILFTLSFEVLYLVVGISLLSFAFGVLVEL